MVERYKHGDPYKDPWWLLYAMKHPKLSYSVLCGAIIFVVGSVVFVLSYIDRSAINYKTTELRVQYQQCIDREGDVILEDIYSTNGGNAGNSTTARGIARMEAASSCCEKLGRYPVSVGGDATVICLAADVTELVYKHSYSKGHP